jgi:hypothetical protein
MSLHGTSRNLGKAGIVLLLAYIIAIPLGFVDDIAKVVLYISIALILVSSFDSSSPSRVLKGLLGRVGGLAFGFWLLLWLFNLAVVPLTGSQLFWTFVSALVIRMAIEIS